MSSDIYLNGITYPSSRKVAFPGKDGKEVVFDLPEDADRELNGFSENPVQNKVIHAAIEDVRQRQTSPYNFKGAVATLADLPSTGQEVNDTYYVEALKYRVTWTGDAWQQSSMSEIDYMDELGALESQGRVNLLDKTLITAGNADTTVTQTTNGIVVESAGNGTYDRGIIDLIVTPGDKYTIDVTISKSELATSQVVLYTSDDGITYGTGTVTVISSSAAGHVRAAFAPSKPYIRLAFLATSSTRVEASASYDNIMLYKGDGLVSGYLPYRTALDAVTLATADNAAEKVGLLTDEYGSVFDTVAQMTEYARRAETEPEYTFHFGDYVVGGFNSDERALSYGISTRNHPILLDDTMAIQTIGETIPGTLLACFGHLDGNGDFVCDTSNIISKTTGHISNRIAYVDQESKSTTHMCISYTDGYSADGLDINSLIRVTMRSPKTELTPVCIDSPARSEGNNRYVKTEEGGPILYYRYPTPALLESGTMGFPVRPGWKWIYCGGLPLTAVFYDRNKDLISGDYETFDVYDSETQYETAVRIPDGAVWMGLCVHGPTAATTNYSLGSVLSLFAPCFGVMADVSHTGAGNTAISNAIHNTGKLLDFRFNAAHYYMKNLAYQNLQYGSRGFPYGRRTPGEDVSFYSYALVYAIAHGFSLSANKSTSYNSHFGFVCTSLISAILCLPHRQGTEYFLQNFADKLELVTPTTQCQVGDLIIMTRYMRTTENDVVRPTLHTHIQLITDILRDREGRFAGYKTAEATGAWTRSKTFESDNPEFLSVLTHTEIETDPDAQLFVWRLPIPFAVPRIEDSYRFGIDRELDTLNQTKFEIPAALGMISDRCIIGPRPASTADYVYDISPPSPSVWVLKPPEGTAFTATLTRPDGTTESINVAAEAASIGTNFAYLSLEPYITSPGVYWLSCSWAETSRFLVPAFPETITVEKQSGNLKPRSVTFNSGFLLPPDSTHPYLHTASFDELWLRVIPYPKVLPGLPNGAPWANYMFIRADELWDGENSLVIDKEKYDYFTMLDMINNTFGCTQIRFAYDNAVRTLDDSPEDDGDEEIEPV